jgi:hypothetical protein
MSKTGSRRRQSARKSRWSSTVTRDSDALDLERNVFVKKTPVAIARSLKRSAERSSRRKSAPVHKPATPSMLLSTMQGVLAERRRAVH